MFLAEEKTIYRKKHQKSVLKIGKKKVFNEHNKLPRKTIVQNAKDVA